MTSGTVTATAAPRGAIGRFWASTVGKKIVMAVSGLIMAGFLIAHMTANLLAFIGPGPINDYSHFLHNTPEILWPARVVLLAAVIVHALSAWQLTRISHAARNTGYDLQERQVATFASRTMRWFSLLLALFIVVHLMHFTTGQLLPGFVEGDPYANLVRAFGTQRFMAAFYLVIMAVLGLHLYHGLWGSIRTLGLSRPRATPRRRPIAAIIAVALWLGFSAVPIGVLTGAIRPAAPAGALATGGR